MTGPLRGEEFLAALRRHGAGLMTGVPCSFLTPVINAALGDADTHYVGATSEGEAVGIAAGTWLAGGSPVVMGQNSGLGNMINPLTSLLAPARIPVLLLCTWRGQPGHPDEPQHELMGRVTTALLDTVEIRWELLGERPEELGACLGRAFAHMERHRLPYALVLRKGVIADHGLDESGHARPARGLLRAAPASGAPVVGTRAQVLERLLEILPEEAPVIATTGKTGRELFTLADRPQHFYLVGAMGCASAVGLGVALSAPRPVVVLDGDGAALMKLGNLATIGTQAPPGLIHVLLDNQVHDSTGGQRTNAGAVAFPEVAVACGYRSATSCGSLSDLRAALGTALAEPGPHLVHVRTATGSMAKLGRPTVPPHEVALRFRDHFSRSPLPPGRTDHGVAHAG